MADHPGSQLASSIVLRGLEDIDPNAIFRAFQGQFGRSPNQRRFAQTQAQNVFDQYRGMLTQQVREGDAPGMTYEQFLNTAIFPTAGSFTGQSRAELERRQRQSASPESMVTTPDAEIVRSAFRARGIQPLSQQFSSLAPSQRGAFTQRFAPQSRFVPF